MWVKTLHIQTLHGWNNFSSVNILTQFLDGVKNFVEKLSNESALWQFIELGSLQSRHLFCVFPFSKDEHERAYSVRHVWQGKAQKK